MSICTCHRCGPAQRQSTKVQVTITLAIVRPGWEDTGYGTIWGEVETEHELRAEVEYHGVDDEPGVDWLDQAVIDDLDLSPHELVGAEEQAAEAAFMKLQAEGYEDPAIAKADHDYDQQKDAQLFGEAG